MGIKRTTKTELSPVAGMGLTVYLDINDDQLYIQDDNGIRALMSDYLPSVVGSNIYNTNGSLTANRVVSGATSYSLSMQDFTNLTLASGGILRLINVDSPTTILTMTHNLVQFNTGGGTFYSYGDDFSVLANNTCIIDVGVAGRIGTSAGGVLSRLEFGAGILSLDATNAIYVKYNGSIRYSLPLNSGTDGQVLTTNGAGSSSWQTPAGSWQKITITSADFSTINAPSGSINLLILPAKTVVVGVIINVIQAATSNSDINTGCTVLMSDWYGSTNYPITITTLFGLGITPPQTYGQDVIAITYYQPLISLGLVAFNLDLLIDNSVEGSNVSTITGAIIEVYIKTEKLP